MSVGARIRWVRKAGAVAALGLIAGLMVAVAPAASAGGAPSPQLDLRVLLIGGPPTGVVPDPTTVAWQTALASEGVPYTLANATGALGSETVSLPALTDPADALHGYFNGVVIADSSAWFTAGQLTGLFNYEATFGVREVDGYVYPGASFGLTDATNGSLSGVTGTLTSDGLSALPSLKGPVPFDTGSYGDGATVASPLPAGASFTSFLNDPAGNTLMGVYRHPISPSDPQSGVSVLAMTFDYSASMLHWLLLSPNLIDWVTNDMHLGLSRNYLGQDIDDTFLADNEWSSQYQCTPAATEPPDYTCPAGVANNPADTPPDVQMSAADVAYVVAWEQSTGITLNLAFNGEGACSAPSIAQASSANCTGSSTVNGTTYTDPGVSVDSSDPDAAGLTNALLANQGSFNWVTHTWSHAFLGCVVWQPLAVDAPVANSTGGTFAAGDYQYEVSAATAYGESEPSVPASVPVAADGSVSLSWPEATNGEGTDGTPGPTLAQEEASHTGGTGFWGYNVYRADPNSSAFGLVGQVAEDPSATLLTTYSFTDTGAALGQTPGSTDTFPTATNPGMGCSSAAGSWFPATSTDPDSSIEQEIGLDDAFAANNGLTNFAPSTVVTGEHSGIENPNFPAALAGTGVTVFASDASRQPQQETLSSGGSTAVSSPRYPSNIYYNASNWADELNEYNTLYVAQGNSLDDPAAPTDTGHCTDTSSTTCRATPATEADVLSSESRIELGHVLDNDPRVGYAHQTDLIGPATQTVGGVTSDYGYTLLTFLDSVLSQYNTWENVPFVQTTDASEAAILQAQSTWAATETAGTVSASEADGVVTITNGGTTDASVPVTAPTGTTVVGGGSFGESYGGTQSAWTPVTTTSPVVLTRPTGAPAFTSAASGTVTAGTPFSLAVTTSGRALPTIVEGGTLPTGLVFTAGSGGTATIAGTVPVGTVGTFPIALGATNDWGTVTQFVTLTVSSPPAFTSAATATSIVGLPFSFSVTTSAEPIATVTETGALPAGISFAPGANGTATLAGTAQAGTGASYRIVLTATNTEGTATQDFTLLNAQAPTITSPPTASFSVGTAGSYLVTTTGYPAANITETGRLPAGLTFHDNRNGTASLLGTPTSGSVGSYPIAIQAANPTAVSTATLNLALAVTATAPNCRSGATGPVVGAPRGISAMQSGACFGYWISTDVGDVVAVGAAPSYGSLVGSHLNGSIIDTVTTHDNKGYYLLGSDGGIFTFGDAKFYGSTGSMHLNKPIVGMAITPTGHGYWLVASDGGIFSFGDAKFYGSMGSTHLNQPVVGMAVTPTGHGYWLVASDGGIFTFGDGQFLGSMGGRHLNQPVVGMTTDPQGRGYRMVASDGGIFSFGAPFYGSLGSTPPAAGVVAMAPSVDGNGYYMLGGAGIVYAFGDAPYLGGA